jgi:hypothetical protein
MPVAGNSESFQLGLLGHEENPWAEAWAPIDAFSEK